MTVVIQLYSLLINSVLYSVIYLKAYYLEATRNYSDTSFVHSQRFKGAVCDVFLTLLIDLQKHNVKDPLEKQYVELSRF